jgi:hypothetical protein
MPLGSEARGHGGSNDPPRSPGQAATGSSGANQRQTQEPLYSVERGDGARAALRIELSFRFVGAGRVCNRPPRILEAVRA